MNQAFFIRIGLVIGLGCLGLSAGAADKKIVLIAGRISHGPGDHEFRAGSLLLSFTGGHHHQNWGNDNFRKVVLNALLWIAKAEVPAGGVASTVGSDDLAQNLDSKGGKK